MVMTGPYIPRFIPNELTHRNSNTPSHTHTLSHTLTHSHIFSGTFTHSRTPSHTQAPSHTVAHLHTLSHTFTHTDTISYTLKHLHTYVRSLLQKHEPSRWNVISSFRFYPKLCQKIVTFNVIFYLVQNKVKSKNGAVTLTSLNNIRHHPINSFLI